MEYVSSLSENEISKIIVDCAYRVHKTLGPGLLESTYETCLFYELDERNLVVERQKVLPVVYNNLKLEAGYRIDLLVENKVIIELKSVKKLDDVHTAQMITYLRLSDCKLGLLINFNVSLIKYGIKRIVNNL
ncbi:GxxExxY protein [Polaribacter cellanae]|uniref:GxxExxY protein n=1 Tax=Polaribacter cellanae TaxID=2818493 RepID=A0A975H6S8_9FLAO|nr:GxxExxY protein [Polaribacter cellanae]QTE22771.1 GxxExxY protein [Polaribacter cellanae]